MRWREGMEGACGELKALGEDWAAKRDSRWASRRDSVLTSELSAKEGLQRGESVLRSSEDERMGNSRLVRILVPIAGLCHLAPNTRRAR